jgi:hypothetical protein
VLKFDTNTVLCEGSRAYAERTDRGLGSSPGTDCRSRCRTERDSDSLLKGEFAGAAFSEDNDERIAQLLRDIVEHHEIEEFLTIPAQDILSESDAGWRCRGAASATREFSTNGSDPATVWRKQHLREPASGRCGNRQHDAWG